LENKIAISNIILTFTSLNQTKKIEIMKTSRIEIGTKVNGSKGQGTITSIITKSTGYVEVTYNSGIVKKEMAFNLTDENGVSLKSKPASQNHGEKLNPSNFMSKEAKANYVTMSRDDFEEMRKNDARNSKSF